MHDRLLSLTWAWQGAAIVVAVLGLLLLLRGLGLRLRRARHPSCPGCGYDLTGHAAKRCPECGAAPARGSTWRRRRRWSGIALGAAGLTLAPLLWITPVTRAQGGWPGALRTLWRIHGLPDRTTPELVQLGADLEAGRLLALQGWLLERRAAAMTLDLAVPDEPRSYAMHLVHLRDADLALDLALRHLEGFGELYARDDAATVFTAIGVVQRAELRAEQRERLRTGVAPVLRAHPELRPTTLALLAGTDSLTREDLPVVREELEQTSPSRRHAAIEACLALGPDAAPIVDAMLVAQAASDARLEADTSENPYQEHAQRVALLRAAAGADREAGAFTDEIARRAIDLAAVRRQRAEHRSAYAAELATLGNARVPAAATALDTAGRTPPFDTAAARLDLLGIFGHRERDLKEARRLAAELVPRPPEDDAAYHALDPTQQRLWDLYAEVRSTIGGRLEPSPMDDERAAPDPR